MDFDLRNRLDIASVQLHERALDLSKPGRVYEPDKAQIMSALAVALEALRVISDDLAAK